MEGKGREGWWEKKGRWGEKGRERECREEEGE